MFYVKMIFVVMLFILFTCSMAIVGNMLSAGKYDTNTFLLIEIICFIVARSIVKD